MTGRRELWMALASFGEEAVAHVVADRRDAHAELTDEQLLAMARRSTIPYWTDGTVLWSIDYRNPGARTLSAAEALAAFGLEALEEAREKGTWQP
jgi:hypothetical protein